MWGTHSEEEGLQQGETLVRECKLKDALWIIIIILPEFTTEPQHKTEEPQRNNQLFFYTSFQALASCLFIMTVNGSQQVQARAVLLKWLVIM